MVKKDTQLTYLLTQQVTHLSFSGNSIGQKEHPKSSAIHPKSSENLLRFGVLGMILRSKHKVFGGIGYNQQFQVGLFIYFFNGRFLDFQGFLSNDSLRMQSFATTTRMTFCHMCKIIEDPNLNQKISQTFIIFPVFRAKKLKKKRLGFSNSKFFGTNIFTLVFPCKNSQKFPVFSRSQLKTWCKRQPGSTPKVLPTKW